MWGKNTCIRTCHANKYEHTHTSSQYWCCLVRLLGWFTFATLKSLVFLCVNKMHLTNLSSLSGTHTHTLHWFTAGSQKFALKLNSLSSLPLLLSQVKMKWHLLQIHDINPTRFLSIDHYPRLYFDAELWIGSWRSCMHIHIGVHIRTFQCDEEKKNKSEMNV